MSHTFIPSMCAISLACGCVTSPPDIPPWRGFAEAEIPSHLYPYEYWSTVSEAQVVAAPAWKHTAGNPPLSARKADELAHAMFRKLSGRPANMERTEIRLIDMGDRIHWYYIVQFDEVNAAITGRPAQANVVVLMDGTVIEPKERKQK